MGSYIGFAPLDQPQVVILVVIDEPHGVSYGGVIAAPAFKEIAEQVLPYMGVYPKGVTYLASAQTSSPHRPLLPAPASKPAAGRGEKTEETAVFPGTMPDFSGKSIRQVIQTAQRIGLELKLEGSGKAVSQSPAPGHAVHGGMKGVVRFQPAI